VNQAVRLILESVEEVLTLGLKRDEATLRHLVQLALNLIREALKVQP
jgi:hypothetical protein